MVSFDVTQAEAEIIHRIAARAIVAAKAAGVKVDRLTIDMDLTACHCNGCPLKLEELLAADDFNFNHDVFGIHRHLDRKSGELTDFFLPRFALPQ